MALPNGDLGIDSCKHVGNFLPNRSKHVVCLTVTGWLGAENRTVPRMLIPVFLVLPVGYGIRVTPRAVPIGIGRHSAAGRQYCPPLALDSTQLQVRNTFEPNHSDHCTFIQSSVILRHCHRHLLFTRPRHLEISTMGFAEILPADLLSAVGALVSLGLIALAYTALLHPLRDYPGPLLAKLTDGYSGYFAAKKCLHLRTYNNHLKYGPVIRMAPNRLVFNTARALKDIYLNPGVNKAHIYKHTQFNPQVNIFGTLDRDRHRQKRKVYGQVLSDRSLRAFEPTMNKEIDVFLKQLLNAQGKAVNMSPAFERLATDIAGQLAFGQPLHTQTQAKNRIFPRAMISMNAVVNLFSKLSPVIAENCATDRLALAWPTVSMSWPVLGRLNRKNGAIFAEAIQGIIQSRMALAKDAKHDFYSIAADDVSTEEGLKRSELWAEAVFFLPAGGTTISAALSAIFFYLSRYPAVYARLAAEIRTKFALGRAIQSGPQLNGSKYLRAVIDESMRMSPPFVGTFWREPYSPHHEQFVVDGYVIPPGTIVGVSPYSVMHNEEYFPEPFAFRPERWLESYMEDGGTDEPSPQIEHHVSMMRAAFAPFALGETGCLGKAMAYQEMSLVVARTLWYFDFERAPGEAGKLGEGEPGRTDGRGRKEEYQLFDLAVSDHVGPNLVFRPREEYWQELGVAGTGL
ncbi:hypothetical protein KVR01_008076 [Diaporthe batatas]|uniref:uncharacterized protein n=1 Tax=Diaporthe batatas TaxID=748121 RepID=UPI001D04FEB5|nr:uncharacterized protein KVR01_008076 [Diaporthe batatas]KAG8162311.1 hypothetical protein KVR01_008076 [Diaporthe batatas]